MPSFLEADVPGAEAAVVSVLAEVAVIVQVAGVATNLEAAAGIDHHSNLRLVDTTRHVSILDNIPAILLARRTILATQAIHTVTIHSRAIRIHPSVRGRVETNPIFGPAAAINTIPIRIDSFLGRTTRCHKTWGRCT